MRDFKIKKYIKKLDYSYAFGVFPTIELINSRPSNISKVLINPKIEKNLESRIKNLCNEKNIKYEFNLKHISKLAPKENTFCIGIFEKYKAEVEPNQNHVVLANPSDMGNVGTIIRSMIGFDFNNLVLIKPAVDIYDPKVVRSSMGSFFKINFSYFNSINEYKQKFPNQNLYSFFLDGNTYLKDTEFNNPISLIFGNEGAGLASEYKNISETIKINHSKNIESLNLANAVSISLYEAFKN